MITPVNLNGNCSKDLVATELKIVNPLLAILVGPGIALVLKKRASFSELLLAIKRSFATVYSNGSRAFLRTSDGAVIPRRLPFVIMCSVLQIAFSLYTITLFFVLTGYEDAEALTAAILIVPSLTVLALFVLQYKLISGDVSAIDKGVDAILRSGEWISSSDILPTNLSELRSENSMSRLRLGVSIEAISVEEIEAGHKAVSQRAKKLGMSVDEYCATTFHRRNGLDPDACDYRQSESLAATLTDD
ncbi:MAG: hypothetical protein AAFR75_01105 [Pseudomonadota bacterium]